jgi:hypothetical protein
MVVDKNWGVNSASYKKFGPTKKNKLTTKKEGSITESQKQCQQQKNNK